MKFKEFQEYLRDPLDLKFEEYFQCTTSLGNLIHENVGFILPVGEPEDVELWKELCAIIPPTYIMAGNSDGKAWVEENLDRSVQFINPWYEADVFMCVLTVPLKRPVK